MLKLTSIQGNENLGNSYFNPIILAIIKKGNYSFTVMDAMEGALFMNVKCYTFWKASEQYLLKLKITSFSASSPNPKTLCHRNMASVYKR